MSKFDSRRCVICNNIVRLDKPYYLDEKTGRPVHSSCANHEAASNGATIMPVKNKISLGRVGKGAAGGAALGATMGSVVPGVGTAIGAGVGAGGGALAGALGKGKKNPNVAHIYRSVLTIMNIAIQSGIKKEFIGADIYAESARTVYGHLKSIDKTPFDTAFPAVKHLMKHKASTWTIKQIDNANKEISRIELKAENPKSKYKKKSSNPRKCPTCKVELISIPIYGGRGMAKECPRCHERYEEKIANNPRKVSPGIVYIATMTRPEAAGVIKGVRKAGFKPIKVVQEGGKWRAYYHTKCREQKNYIHESITPKEWYETFRTINIDGHVLNIGYSGYDPKTKKHRISELHHILHPKSEKSPCKLRTKLGERWTTRREAENIGKSTAKGKALYHRKRGLRARVMPIGEQDYDVFVDGKRARENRKESPQVLPYATLCILEREARKHSPKDMRTYMADAVSRKLDMHMEDALAVVDNYFRETEPPAEENPENTQVRCPGCDWVGSIDEFADLPKGYIECPMCGKKFKEPASENMALETVQSRAKAIRAKGYRARSIQVKEGDYQIFKGGKRKLKAIGKRIKKALRKPRKKKVSRPKKAPAPRIAPTVAPPVAPIELPTSPVMVAPIPPLAPPAAPAEVPKEATDADIAVAIAKQLKAMTPQ